MNPTVSIVLPTYNGESRGYLKQAIDSVIHQTYTNCQLVIIDDGSTDQTEALCRSFLDFSGVEYYRQSNKGLSAARNAGIQRAKGEYLLFLDDDDLYEENMVELMLGAFKQNDDPKVGMIYCAYTFIDENGQNFGRWYIPADGNIYDRLFYDNYAGSPSGTMVHRSVFENVGLFDEELKSCEDYDMWIRIAKHYHVYSIDTPLLRYRIHSSNMSGNIHKIETYQKEVLDNALKSCPQRISDNKHLFYHHLYLEFASKYFEVGDYKNFRRCYNEYRKWGKVETKWRLKYWLSHLPRLTRKLFDIKHSLINQN